MGDTDVDLYGEDLPEDTGELQVMAAVAVRKKVVSIGHF